MAEKNEDPADVVQNDEEVDEASKAPLTMSQKWTNLINGFRRPIMRVLHFITDKSAANPKVCITIITVLSLALIVIGVTTNFNVDVNEDRLYTPLGSRPLQHNSWIKDESGFPKLEREGFVYVHANGANVVDKGATQTAMEIVDLILTNEEIQSFCREKGSVPGEDCYMFGVGDFFNNSLAIFNEVAQTDAGAAAAISGPTFPDGRTVERRQVFGRPVVVNNTLESAETQLVLFSFPDEDGVLDIEQLVIDLLTPIKESADADPNSPYRVDFFVQRSFSDEFTRAIVDDIPLVPIVFIVMSVFTSIIFLRRDWVYSRALLGFGAVISVLLSIMTGYGILFMIGVPFTSMAQILPFVMFGIGLDDAFIITGAYARTDKTKTPEERIHDTIEQVGLSILLTTFTSVVAFSLGCLSSIPAVLWLCSYAFPTILIDFLYQITFFVAVIVIDERRVADKRRDCLVCCTVKSRVNNGELEEDTQEGMFDRLMGAFAEHVLSKIWVKVLVIVAFASLLGACVYNATLLTQEFKFTDVLPSDSYVADFWNTSQEHTTASGVGGELYFRFVNQADPDIQDQMEQYVNDMVSIRQVTSQPHFFWLRYFKTHLSENPSIQNLPFNEQIADFLSDPVNKKLFGDDMVLDADGNVIESRCDLSMEGLDQDVVTEAIEALADQNAVSARQPINQNRDEFAFFYFDDSFFIFEFYTAAPKELALTTIIGVASVTAIAMLLIPHWTAALLVGPLIAVLYVDLLGTMQMAGLHINVVTYVALVMSIGLLVDFLMHVLLRYYESPMEGREPKVKDTLKTMGSSILIGGISTFLGVIPLAFSTSTIFNSIFVTFIGLVTLGAGHGLILLPVLLSLVGPKDKIDFGHEMPAAASLKIKDDEALEEEVAEDEG